MYTQQLTFISARRDSLTHNSCTASISEGREHTCKMLTSTYGDEKAVTTGRRGARATRRPNPPPRIAPYARAGHHNHNQHDGTLAVARLPSRSPHCAQAEVARLSHEKTGTLSLLLSLLLGLGRGSSLAASGALLPLPGRLTFAFATPSSPPVPSPRQRPSLQRGWASCGREEGRQGRGSRGRWFRGHGGGQRHAR
jgi:hypothetical protein